MSRDTGGHVNVDFDWGEKPKKKAHAQFEEPTAAELQPRTSTTSAVEKEYSKEGQKNFLASGRAAAPEGGGKTDWDGDDW